MTIPTVLERIWFGHSQTLSSDGLLLADGTLWSHAASLGTRFKGTAFTIDQPCVENFVKVFSQGYPQKIPVDYDHGSTSPDPDIKKLRVQGSVPKAGDVQELRGIFSASEFTGELKAAAEKLSAQAGRPLDDPRNLGLWMRWKPTARALQAIKAGEYTELSIAFDDDLPHNVDGSGQGPGLWAVALLNTPFLDDMLPVAASRETGRSPAAPGSREGGMKNLTVLSVAAAVLGRAMTSEDEALQELSNLGPQLVELKVTTQFRDILAAEFGNEKDAAKIVAAVRELRAKVTSAETTAKDAKAKELKASVDATMDKHKNKLTVPLRELMAVQLTTELEAGVKLEDTKTVKALESMKALGIFTQESSGDAGAAGTEEDDKLEARAQEILKTDPFLSKQAANDRYGAYMKALERADRELRTAAR